MQLLSCYRVDGVHNDMRVYGLRIGVGGDDALTAFKHFLRASLGVLLNHKRVGVVRSVWRQLEVIILSLSALRTFAEHCRRLPELLGVVLVDKQILHVYKPCLIFAGYVCDCLVRLGFTRNAFEQRHFNFPRWRRTMRGMPPCNLQQQTTPSLSRRGRSSNSSPPDSGYCPAV